MIFKKCYSYANLSHMIWQGASETVAQ